MNFHHQFSHLKNENDFSLFVLKRNWSDPNANGGRGWEMQTVCFTKMNRLYTLALNCNKVFVRLGWGIGKLLWWFEFSWHRKSTLICQWHSSDASSNCWVMAKWVAVRQRISCRKHKYRQQQHAVSKWVLWWTTLPDVTSPSLRIHNPPSIHKDSSWIHLPFPIISIPYTDISHFHKN